MSSQYKVDSLKVDKYATQPAHFRGQVLNVTPELGAVSLLLVPN